MRFLGALVTFHRYAAAAWQQFLWYGRCWG